MILISTKKEKKIILTDDLTKQQIKSTKHCALEKCVCAANATVRNRETVLHFYERVDYRVY